ncbi:MAG: nucleotidyltransferase domain-containing protein [Candidatus Brocadiae bacterium]|nr:nucleotidyltransferase domain-containing protein [Candidatus Brocadiia bacterium]
MNRQEIWRELKRRLEAAYGDRLKGVLVYGSEARGSASPDSDVDVMVLLQGPVHLWEEIGRSVDATYALALEIGRPIHPDPVDVAEFEAGEFSLYRNVKAEGVRL